MLKLHLGTEFFRLVKLCHKSIKKSIPSYTFSKYFRHKSRVFQNKKHI